MHPASTEHEIRAHVAQVINLHSKAYIATLVSSKSRASVS